MSPSTNPDKPQATTPPARSEERHSKCGHRHKGGCSRAGEAGAVIATGGGTAAPEAPSEIEHREALIYMLCEAAELP